MRWWLLIFAASGLSAQHPGVQPPPQSLQPPPPAYAPAQASPPTHSQTLKDVYFHRLPAYINAWNDWITHHNPDTISSADLERYRTMLRARKSFEDGMKDLGYK